MKKRLLLTLMSVMLLFGISAVSVFADSTTVTTAEQFETAIENENFDITIGAEKIELNDEVTISKMGTIDLAGNRIETPKLMKITAGGVTIKDTSQSKLGAIVLTKSDDSPPEYWAALIVEGSGAKLILDSGTLHAAKNTVLQVTKGATADINGGEIECTDDTAVAAYSQAGSTITVNGGTINARSYALTTERGTVVVKKGTIKSDNAYALAAYYSPATITVDGGTITGGVGGVRPYYSAEATINGGDISGGTYGVYVGGTTSEGKVSIEGGNIKGDTYGVYVYGGNAAISGGVITSQGDNCLGTASDSAKIEVTGGTYSSTPTYFTPENVDVFAYVDKENATETTEYFCVTQNDAEAFLEPGDVLIIKNPGSSTIELNKELFDITIKNETGAAITVNGIIIPDSSNPATGQTSATITLADVASDTVIRLAALTGAEYTLPEGTIFTAPAGKRFAGWSDGTTVLNAGATANIEANTTFTAQWENIPPAAPTKGDPSEIKATDKAKSATDSDGKSLVQDTDYKLKDGGADFLPAYTDTFTGEKTVKIVIGNKYYEFTVKGTKAALIDIATLEAEIEDAAYTGEPAFPTVTLTTADGTVVDPENYEITYNNPLSTEVGTYGFVITGKKAYTGSVEKEYNIIPPTKEIAKVVPGKKGKAKKSFTVKWKKAGDTEIGGIDGYEVQYSVKKNFKKAKTKAVKKNTAKKVKIKKGVKKGKKYFVMLRAYKKVDDVKYYSDWSAVKKVKTKK